MAYISPENVKKIRETIRKEFPTKDGWKISVTTRHNSGVLVTLLEGTVDFGTNYEQVNQYYIKERYEDNPKASEVLSKIYSLCNDIGGGSYNRNANDPTADYSSFTYYINIHIGRWNKDYKLIKKEIKTIPSITGCSKSIFGIDDDFDDGDVC